MTGRWCAKCQAYGTHETEGHDEFLKWDYGEHAMRVAVDHVTACIDFMDSEDPEEEFPDGDPASAPFDGCLDCMVRESLFAASPIFESAMHGCPHMPRG